MPLDFFLCFLSLTAGALKSKSSEPGLSVVGSTAVPRRAAFFSFRVNSCPYDVSAIVTSNMESSSFILQKFKYINYKSLLKIVWRLNKHTKERPEILQLSWVHCNSSTEP